MTLGWVQNSAELERIRALPRREWTDAQADALADRLTQALKTPQGTKYLAAFPPGTDPLFAKRTEHDCSSTGVDWRRRMREVRTELDAVFAASSTETENESKKGD